MSFSHDCLKLLRRLDIFSVSTSAHSDNTTASGYAPFAQLVKMLLPSARCVAVYDAATELVWCSDGYERPDLRALLEHQRANETLASRGSVETTADGIPVFISGLRGADARPLGSLVIELGGGLSSRSTPSMVVSMLRPVLDCIENKLDLERSSLDSERNVGLEVLLMAAEDDGAGANALQELLKHCALELNCIMGALLVPDKNLDVSWTAEESTELSQLISRTQKHLLAWARLNNRPMIVNRPGGGAPYKILSCPLREPNGHVLGLVALFRAATSDDFEPRDVRILEFVGRKAVAVLDNEYDGLTGLPSRTIFERRVQKVLDRTPASLLYVDIDKLAAINEAFGLSAGDEVIQRIGAFVQRAADAEGGFGSRIVGDRFALALPECSLEQASELGARLLGATSQLGYLNGAQALQVAVSIGAVAAPAGVRLPHLLAAAELACKRAKANGGGRVAAIDDAASLAPAETRQAIAAEELRGALAANSVQLEAQPIVGLDARRGSTTAGYELLVRLRDASGQLLSPDKFLDACSLNGLLPALDRCVLGAAVEMLRPHAEALAGAPLFFSVNVSAQSLQSRRYAAFALETLAGAGLSPGLFCFEIKESAAAANLGAADAMIRELKKAGAKVALDDFGAGMSSLAHLKQLPVDYLKIDGRFVRRIATDRIAESIVSGIARAARTLGVPTIAEHVESLAVAERLRDLDVTHAQGFHYGRPEPFADIVRQIEDSLEPVAHATTAG